MTDFLISNEAGKAGAAFAAQAEDALYRAAPRIEELSAMPLPEEVRVRLVTPGDLLAISKIHFDLVGERIADGFEDDEQRAIALKVAAEQGREFNMFEAIGWPLIGGQVVMAPDGPELITMPRMHKKARTSQRKLVQTLGHELVHIAQVLRWPDMYVAFSRQAVESVIGTRERAAILPILNVSEAHAMFVHRKLVAELGGTDDTFPGDPKPQLGVRIRQRMIRNRSITPNADLYLRGQKFMAALHDAGGAHLVASVFDGEGHIPTGAELDNPELWLHRLCPELAASAALQTDAG